MPRKSVSTSTGNAGATEFPLIEGFKKGYRNREDITVLPPGIMVQGSQNVLTNTFNRVGIRKGYTLDGQAETDISPILASFDWPRHTGDTRHLRAGFNTTGENGKLQYRYVAAEGDNWNGNTFTEGQIYWIDLVTGLDNTLLRFCDFWDFNNELKSLLLWVNGKSQIWEWSGGVTTLKSSSNAMGVIETFLQPGQITAENKNGGGNGYTTGDILLINVAGKNATVRATALAGVLTSTVLIFGGSGYAAPALNQPLLGGTGNGGTVDITAVTSNAGLGYLIDDVLTATGGNGDATFRVADVTDSGAIKDLVLLTPGTGYSISTFPLAGGTGAGAEVKVTAVAQGYIEKFGTSSWAEEGFYNVTNPRSVVINGNIYTYTGGETTTFIVGISPDPTGEPLQSVIHQNPIITLNQQMDGIPVDFKNTLIENLKNQIYVGASDNQSIYVSQVNNYKDYTFSTPVRSPGEGAILTLDGIPTALSPQQTQMYASAGKDQWYFAQFIQSADLASESLDVERLKTTSFQAAQTQENLTKIKNNLCFVSFESIVNILGTAQNFLNDPQTQDLSFPIVNDMNSYDFTDGSIIYHKQFVYIAVPKEQRVLVYNMTDPQNPYWEAPQVLPVGRFSVIEDELYGHGYQVSETYKLFNGFNDNGLPIPARAAFSFHNYGMRAYPKRMTEYYVEGYISQNMSGNSSLFLEIQYDVDGCSRNVSYPIDGNDSQIVCINGPALGSGKTGSNSLGKFSLGKVPLGGNAQLQSILDTPPKFRVIKTMSSPGFYEEQTSFASNAVDARWEILAFGSNSLPASESNVAIKQ